MKAITLHQPWAQAIAVGLKTHETRSWSTKHRGPLAIHAALRVDWGEEQEVVKTIGHWVDVFDLLPLGDPRDWPRGGVLAIANLVDVIPTDRLVRGVDISDQEWAFGNFARGRFAWRLEQITRVDPAIPARGHQGLWDWGPPARLVR